MRRWNITANNTMKKNLLWCAIVMLLLASCSSNDPDQTKKQILGKSFKNYWVQTYTHSVHETQTIVSFPHERVCHIYIVGHEYSDNGDNDSYTRNLYFEYKVNGNNITLFDLVTEEIEDQFTFVYTNGKLIHGSDEYTENGTVEMDYSLGNRLPPEGERTYLEEGWYESGSLEGTVRSYAAGCIEMGDVNGLRNLPEKLRSTSLDYYDHVAGMHVADRTTVESTIADFSTTRPSAYYATQTYSIGTTTVTYYFFYVTYLDSYQYRLIDNEMYLLASDGTWQKGWGSLIDGEKVEYNGGYVWGNN